MVAGFEPGNFGLRNPRLTTELPKPTTTTSVTKYVFIFNMASRTIWPSTCAIPQFQFWLINLIKCIIKAVNVSKSQYYEFRHNIMNLGNQNSKYSWRIRDLENLQTGTQFANSVLMYKIYNRHSGSCPILRIYPLIGIKLKPWRFKLVGTCFIPGTFLNSWLGKNM